MSFLRSVILGSVLIGLVGVGNAVAGSSGVIRIETPDAAVVGKGDAFVGEANRPSAVYFNPAGIVQMDSAQLSAGVTFLQPQINYTAPSGEKLQMIRNTFIFPHVYVTTPVANKFYVGIGENSNWGAGNSWSPDSLSTFTRYSMIHDEFDNQDIMFVGAYKVNDQLSFGV